MNISKVKNLSIAMASGLALSLAGISCANAESNPFQINKLGAGYNMVQTTSDLAATEEDEKGKKGKGGKCGNGQCG